MKGRDCDDPRKGSSLQRAGGWQAVMSLIGGRITGALFATAWLVLAARVLAPAQFGRLAVVIGIGTVASVVVEGGYPLLVAEAIGSDNLRFHAVVRGALRVRLPLATFAGAATAAIAWGIDGMTGLATGAAYGVWIAASAAQSTFGPGLRAIGKAKVEAIGEAASRVLTLLIGAPLLWTWRSPVAVALAYGAGSSLAVLWMWWVARRIASPVAAERWRVSAQRVLPLGVAGVLVTLYNRADVWLLALLASSADVGVYAASYRFYEGLVLPATAFGALLIPAVAATPTRMKDLVRQYVTGALVFAAAGSAALAIAAPVLVRYVLGTEFLAAVGPVRILSIAAIPASVFSAVAPLASLRSKRGGSGVLVLGVAATLVLNAALIPTLGAPGAAISMVASQSLMAGCFVAVVRRRSPERGGGSHVESRLDRSPVLG